MLAAVWVLPLAYAAAFAGVRAYALALKPEMVGNPAGTSIGRVVSVSGFHVHHVYVGALIVAAVIAIVAARRRLGYPGAIALGVGLALVVDEVGLVASGFTEYNVAWRMPLAIAFGLALVALAWIAGRARARARHA